MDRSSEAQPLVTLSQAELDAKLDATREAGRLSAAKGAGFESVAELEEALGAMAELDKARQREAESQEELDQAKAELQDLRAEQEAQLQVLDLGGTPSAIADILTLRVTDDDLHEDGEPNVDAIRGSIEGVFNAHPQLRGGQQVGVSERGSAATSTGSSALGDAVKASLKERFRR
jgi:hypothetical protein